jgi:FkbM family methyltransferase
VIRISTLLDAYRLRGVVHSPWRVARARDSRAHARGPLTVHLRSGGQLSLRHDSQDHSIFREILVSDVYRLRSLPASLDTVVDLGGNIGMFSLAIADRARRVIAAEPVPTNAACFRSNTAHLSNVELFEGAVVPVEGPIELFAPRERDSGRFSQFGDESAAQKFTAPGITLDQFCAQYNADRIDLLKIDIEGGEYDLLAAESERTLRRVDRIVGEYHAIAGKSMADLEASLTRAGLLTDFVPMPKRPGQGTFFSRRPG